VSVSSRTIQNLHSPASRAVQSIARNRSRRGVEVADRLAVAALACGSKLALGVADMMRECSSPANVWTAQDLHNGDGELFDGVGTYSSCGARLCPSCSAALRRRARRRARVALDSCPLLTGEHARLVTLTMPTVADASLLETMHAIERAWSLLRKRKFWRESVRAGIKGVEFTVTSLGYNTHIHILAVSRWIAHAGLRSEWTHCVRVAWRERGREIAFNTPSGEAIVDVRLVRAKAGASHASITQESALQEVLKYVCKPDAWLNVPESHLVEVAEVERFPRLFEVFGAMRASHETERASDADTSLDTPSISDGGQLMISFPESSPSVARARPPSLRSLVLTCDRPAWLKTLAHHFANRRAYRRGALCARYPYAIFQTLAGDVSFGVACRYTSIERENNL